MKKKKILKLLLLGTVGFASITSGNIFANENVASKELKAHVKRRYVTIRLVRGFESRPTYYFYNDNGYKGWLTINFDESTDYSVAYSGYIYAGDQYPDFTSVNASNWKKYVRVYVHYTGDITRLPNYWYNDGYYHGWLYERNAEVYQRKDGTWDVYYKGEVIDIHLARNIKKDID